MPLRQASLAARVQELESALASERAGGEGARAKLTFLTEKVGRQVGRHRDVHRPHWGSTAVQLLRFQGVALLACGQLSRMRGQAATTRAYMTAANVTKTVMMHT